MEKKMKKRIPFMLVLILIFSSCTGKVDFDENYWKNTNDFYMVYDMSESFEESKALSSLEMFKISRRRTKMAKKIKKTKKLSGLTENEVSAVLGPGNPKFIIGDGYQNKNGYSNSLQYVIEAEKRGFQFYGESGVRRKYMIVFLDKEDIVISVDLIKQKY